VWNEADDHDMAFAVGAVIASRISSSARARRGLAGNARLRKVKLRTILKVSTGADKKLTAEFYSIDQTTDPLPVDSISQEGKAVKFALPMIHGSFVGTLSADSNSIDGTFSGQMNHGLMAEVSYTFSETRSDAPYFGAAPQNAY
jgi:hypothetical protein